jgi:hypothetical protein
MKMDFQSNIKKVLSRLWPFLVLGIIVVNYSNCSSSKMSYDENPNQGSTGTLDLQTICSQTELDLFSKGYHPFLTTSCNNCHASGPGKGNFAHADAVTAFNGFQSLGYEKVSANAVSDSHNYPYTGGQNLELVTALKEQWRTFQTEKLACKDSSDSKNTAFYSPHFISSKKPIPKITGTPKIVNINGTATAIIEYNVGTVSFNLDQELKAIVPTPVPSTGGATLSFSVTGYSTPSGLTGYVFTMPKLKTGSNSVHIKGFHLAVNGMAVPYALTFQNTDRTLYKNSEQMLSGGSMLALGPLLEGDQLSVTIGDLEVVDITAPPAPPIIQFQSANSTVPSTQLGYATPYKVSIELSIASDKPVTVGLATSGDENLANIAKGPLASDGKNRFNWDYRLTGGLNITLMPGEIKKEIEIIFSDDLRDEIDKTLTLKLVDPFGASLGSKSTQIINLPDYNPTITESALTFSELMNPGGVLEANCVRCHNSLDKQGGYDMTDYQMMVTRGVILPGNMDPNAHKMYRRMNPDAPDAGTVTPMPLKGYLSQDQTLIVEDWIKAGAKNN